VVNAVGQLLQSTVRQSDIVAKSGDAEFTLATGSIQFDSARNFAQRICGAIASVNVVKDDGMQFVASCGLASLSEYGPDATSATLSLNMLRDIAHQRAALGLHHAVSGVVGAEEEAAFRHGMDPVSADEMLDSAVSDSAAAAASTSDAPELATLLQWIKDGKQDQVLQHMGKLSAELQPLIDFMLKQTKR
jgi:hypothetical protein